MCDKNSSFYTMDKHSEFSLAMLIDSPFTASCAKYCLINVALLIARKPVEAKQ